MPTSMPPRPPPKHNLISILKKSSPKGNIENTEDKTAVPTVNSYHDVKSRIPPPNTSKTTGTKRSASSELVPPVKKIRSNRALSISSSAKKDLVEAAVGLILVSKFVSVKKSVAAPLEIPNPTAESKKDNNDDLAEFDKLAAAAIKPILEQEGKSTAEVPEKAPTKLAVTATKPSASEVVPKIGDVGYTFRKCFHDGWFKGKVVAIRHRAEHGKNRRCEYEDGDTEDLSLAELKMLAKKEHLSLPEQEGNMPDANQVPTTHQHINFGEFFTSTDPCLLYVGEPVPKFGHLFEIAELDRKFMMCDYSMPDAQESTAKTSPLTSSETGNVDTEARCVVNTAIYSRCQQPQTSTTTNAQVRAAVTSTPVHSHESFKYQYSPVTTSSEVLSGRKKQNTSVNVARLLRNTPNTQSLSRKLKALEPKSLEHILCRTNGKQHCNSTAKEIFSLAKVGDTQSLATNVTREPASIMKPTKRSKSTVAKALSSTPANKYPTITSELVKEKPFEKKASSKVNSNNVAQASMKSPLISPLKVKSHPSTAATSTKNASRTDNKVTTQCPSQISLSSAAANDCNVDSSTCSLDQCNTLVGQPNRASPRPLVVPEDVAKKVSLKAFAEVCKTTTMKPSDSFTTHHLPVNRPVVLGTSPKHALDQATSKLIAADLEKIRSNCNDAKAADAVASKSKDYVLDQVTTMHTPADLEKIRSNCNDTKADGVAPLKQQVLPLAEKGLEHHKDIMKLPPPKHAQETQAQQVRKAIAVAKERLANKNVVLKPPSDEVMQRMESFKKCFAEVPEVKQLNLKEKVATIRALRAATIARCRARKKEHLKKVVEGIELFRSKLGMPPLEDNPLVKKPVSRKGVSKPVYLPPPEQMALMTSKELSEWRRIERKKRRVDAERSRVLDENNRLKELSEEYGLLCQRYKLLHPDETVLTISHLLADDSPAEPVKENEPLKEETTK